MSQPGPDPEFPEWHPDLNGPLFQPNGGPNGTTFSIAIVRPGISPDDEDERDFMRLCEKDMAEAYQGIIPHDDEDEKIEGPPHHDPISGSSFPRKLGMTKTGWEVWLDDHQLTYYYHRSANTTKYSWTQAEIDADEKQHTDSVSVRKGERHIEGRGHHELQLRALSTREAETKRT